MFILSQDKSSIVNTDNCAVITISQTLNIKDEKIFKILAGTPTPNDFYNGYVNLGIFSNLQEAKIILNEIFCNKSNWFIMPERVGGIQYD